MSEDDTLAAFCAQLRQMRRILRGPASAPRRALLERAAHAARHGEPITPYLQELGLQPAPRWWTRDPGPSTRGGLPTPVDADGSVVTGVYVCPQGICSRIVLRRADSELPTCHLHDRALRFVPDDE